LTGRQSVQIPEEFTEAKTWEVKFEGQENSKPKKKRKVRKKKKKVESSEDAWAITSALENQMNMEKDKIEAVPEPEENQVEENKDEVKIEEEKEVRIDEEKPKNSKLNLVVTGEESSMN
jgi:hypothetical protein